MWVARVGWLFAAALAPLCASGCQFVPKSQLDAAELKNRSLVESQNGLLAQYENLKVHARQLEDQVKQADEELAEMEERSGSEHRQLSNYEREREQLQKHLGGLARGATGGGASGAGRGVPANIGRRLSQLSQRHAGLEFDAQSGASKLDNDVLFDSGQAEIRRDAYPLLDEFADLLKSPEARQLRVMVVGHTDNRKIAKRQTRERYPDNWHLASARALAVAEHLQAAGVREEQLGVTSFGRHQPIASNKSSPDRQRNRRVEIFVTGPDTPIVGWTETTMELY
jgi:chemotaxis protein MotB